MAAADAERPGAPTLQAALGPRTVFCLAARRLVTRWERHVENVVAMPQLGCMLILPNRL